MLAKPRANTLAPIRDVAGTNGNRRSIVAPGRAPELRHCQHQRVVHAIAEVNVSEGTFCMASNISVPARNGTVQYVARFRLDDDPSDHRLLTDDAIIVP